MRRLAALIVPAVLQDAGNQLSIALGHDVPPGDTYNVPLCAIGGGAPTHYGTSTLVTAEFEAMIVAAKSNIYPEWPPEMLVLAQAVVPELIADFTANLVPAGIHFDAVAAAHGLARWMPELETEI